jgi:hypothetical protein
MTLWLPQEFAKERCRKSKAMTRAIDIHTEGFDIDLTTNTHTLFPAD